MKKITILLFTAAAMASGCKRFTDINQNPNQPTSVTPNVLLSAALAASGNSIATDFFNEAHWMEYWSRSGNYTANIPVEQYSITTGTEDVDFQDYMGTLSKYHGVEASAFASPSTLAFYLGVAKTMKALHYSTLVDGFGNVPYSQAFNISKYITPKYDDAATVYSNLITQLDSADYYFNKAITYYQTAPANVITTDDKYDIMFGRGAGTAPAVRIGKWIQFANTVKLKLLMNETDITGLSSTITSEIAKTTGGYLTPGLIASVNPEYGTASQAQVSPFYGAFYTNGGQTTINNNQQRANTYAVNFYQLTGDTYRPQLQYIPLSGTTIGSNYEGDLNSVSNALTSQIGTGVLKAPTQDQVIMTDFEGLFTQAEATLRGFLPGGQAAANTLLQEAIEQDFIFLGDNAADADSYYQAGAADANVSIAGAVANPVSSTSNVDKTPGMQALLTQKWIALNSVNWFQAYTDFRRSGFPLYNPAGTGYFGPSHAQTHVTHNGGVYIPYRFLYPQSEFDTNGANVPGGITPYIPIFWDTREK
jgi:hypothetical protein